jgi:hypothetical protein
VRTSGGVEFIRQPGQGIEIRIPLGQAGFIAVQVDRIEWTQMLATLAHPGHRKDVALDAAIELWEGKP